jgi:hypothetical protein
MRSGLDAGTTMLSSSGRGDIDAPRMKASRTDVAVEQAVTR